MKNLYIIGGTMGVGKTSVCKSLEKKLSNAVFLDGDWCWDSHPFIVNDETKTMVTQNICFLLNQFIHCSSYNNIIFCWVMHNQSIIDTLLSNIDTDNCSVKVISLICNSVSLKERLEQDISNGIRTGDILQQSIARIPLYEKLNTIKIDTNNLDINEIADLILAL